MDYPSRVAADEPIGSGVTEAACKVIVKQRLWLGDEVDGGRCGGGAEPEDVELHTGAMGISSGRR
jgi:hypothetical protein